MASIPSGTLKPFLREADAPGEIAIRAFYLDVYPVTNGDFLEFVRAHPRWRRSQVKRIFADDGYLQHWSDDLSFDEKLARSPVTRVSWFAAKAYAQWKGKRLPTLAEWEYAAAPAQGNGGSAGDDPGEILRWYAAPAPRELPVVGGRRANSFGVHDLHGLIWEWVSDFNTALVSGDARGDTGLDRRLFCGAGAQDAADRSDYAAFMRFGFRSSLKAGYTVHNLGFRCAKDL
jgi:formylglycine-generating enzyme required for sulfatase activity